MKNTKQIRLVGTTHYPHGWLGLTSNFTGISPTIDSGIWKHHTLLVDVKKIDKKDFEKWKAN